MTIKFDMALRGGAVAALLLFGILPAFAQAGAIQQSGPATVNDGLCFVQNGVAKDCGFPPSPGTYANVLRPITTGASDIALIGDGTIAWDSSTTSAKTEFLFACVPSTNGYILTIKDQIGTAGTYRIAVTPNGLNTIDNVNAAYFLSFNLQSYTFQCNGAANNWVVE